MRDTEKLKLAAIALKRLQKLDLQASFDPAYPETRPTKMQEEICKDFGTVKQQWIVAANQSGKSQTSLRNLSWMVTDTHPYWKRPKEWQNEPLLAIVLSRTGKQIEDSIVPRLISYFEEGSYKIVRVGNLTQRIELTNGNKIVFQSYENPRQARERIQSYVAHLIVIDEMPQTADLVHEALRRVQTRGGYLLAAFTPLLINSEIRKMVDGAGPPYGKRYQLKMFDNPRFHNPAKQAEVLKSMEAMSHQQRMARLEGEWMTPDNAVYSFDYDGMVRELPPHYSPAWRHMESADPAISSSHGFVLAAEDPYSGHWYVVKATYLTGLYDPAALVEKCLEMTKGYNVIRRVADSAESWFTGAAHAKGVTYIPTYKKADRKQDLIKNFQASLGNKLFITPWCQELIDEVQTCSWSETVEGKIANSSKYHIIDACHYLVDNLPKPEVAPISLNWEQELKQQHLNVKKKEALASKKEVGRMRVGISGRTGNLKRRW